jgi:hypothetical protein
MKDLNWLLHGLIPPGPASYRPSETP